MKVVFFHDNELTIAYDLEILDGVYEFKKNQDIVINLGISVKHPKDSPNRKLGNEVAAGRMNPVTMTITDISQIQNGEVLFFAKTKGTIFVFEKKSKNKNFYLVGCTCLE
jgi:hypothetical protein